MYSFEELALEFKNKFETKHFPAEPESLYASCDYFLAQGGKRVRPVICLMGNELFDTINPDNTALLAGDVMLIVAYDYLNKINASYLRRVLSLFNKTAREVCEGQ